MDDLGLYHSSLKDGIIWESVEKSRDELRVVHGPFLDYFFLIFGLFFLIFFGLLCPIMYIKKQQQQPRTKNSNKNPPAISAPNRLH